MLKIFFKKEDKKRYIFLPTKICFQCDEKKTMIITLSLVLKSPATKNDKFEVKVVF